MNKPRTRIAEHVQFQEAQICQWRSTNRHTVPSLTVPLPEVVFGFD